MSETDRRLKDHLDTNQAMRERMCLEILSVERKYTDVRPRLPKGGPDGGRDLEGYFEDQLFYGAVGFVNGATDLDQHRRQIKAKFEKDLTSAVAEKHENKGPPKVFVFFTNVGCTPAAISEMQRYAYDHGIERCDIFDRERMRIALDSNRGYAIRFRYLDIHLTDAEQKDFFATWSDEITSAISIGLTGIDNTAKRVQFLLESQLLLSSLGVRVTLDDSIWNVCNGQFFFQTQVWLRVQSSGLIGWKFGGGTERGAETVSEWNTCGQGHPRHSQYGFGFSRLLVESDQYTRYTELAKELERPKNCSLKEHLDLVRTFRSQGVLEVDSTRLYFSTLSRPFIHQRQPTCKLIELDGCMVLFNCNREIAEHMEEIVIIAGGYDLLTLRKHNFRIEEGSFDSLSVPLEGKHQPKSHEWATLRPAGLASHFSIDLMSETPKRYDW